MEQRRLQVRLNLAVLAKDGNRSAFYAFAKSVENDLFDSNSVCKHLVPLAGVSLPDIAWRYCIFGNQHNIWHCCPRTFVIEENKVWEWFALSVQNNGNNRFQDAGLPGYVPNKL